MIRALLALLLLAAPVAGAAGEDPAAPPAVPQAVEPAATPAPPTAPLPAVESAAALLERARRARDDGRLDEALRTLDELLAGAPDHLALLDRGQVLAWQGRYAEALQAYRSFRERHPDRALDADLRIAQVQAWSEALAAATETLAPWVARGERRAVLDDATYRSWRNELDEVVRRLGGWLAAHPFDREARLALARVRTWQGRNADARAEYLTVLADAPEERDAAVGLARLDLWAGRPSAARARLAALPPEARRDPELRLLEARLAQAEGRDGEARRLAAPLRSGSSAKEAGQLVEELAAAHGPWGRASYARTETSEGLVQQLPGFVLPLPAGEGHLDLGGGWNEVAFHGETRGGAVLEVGLAQPLGTATRLDGGLGWRDGFGGRRGLTARGGATLTLRPELTLRLDAARQLLDATPQAVDLVGAMTTAEAGLTLAAGEATTVAASGGLAWLSAGSWRRGGLISGEHRWKAWRLDLRAGAVARAFGYSESLPLGFFNPTSYRYGGATGAATFGRGGALELEASGQGGWQKVNADAARFAWGYAVTAAYGHRGWQLLAVWSQSFAGLPVESSADPATYWERTIRLALRYSPGG